MDVDRLKSHLKHLWKESIVNVSKIYNNDETLSHDVRTGLGESWYSC